MDEWALELVGGLPEELEERCRRTASDLYHIHRSRRSGPTVLISHHRCARCAGRRGGLPAEWFVGHAGLRRIFPRGGLERTDL